MILSASLIALILLETGNHRVFGQVAGFAPRTYDVYDRPTPSIDTHRARITPGLELRQLLVPDSHMAKALNSRPTSYPSIPYVPVTINETQECVLWDSTCHGNRSAAVLGFFNETMPRLLEDSCFTTGPQWDLTCTESPKPSPSLVDHWSTIRSWMRAPACTIARDEALRLDPKIQAYHDPIYGNCCGNCGIGGPNVDVYYWESPNADTDCLSIVGTNVSPLLDGATTKGAMTYWGVTTVDTDEHDSILTTAVYTSVNGISFKLPLRNPWDAVTQADGIHQEGPPVSITPGRGMVHTDTSIATTTFPGITPPPSVQPSVTAHANVIPIRRIRPRAGRNESHRNPPTTEAPSLPTNGSHVSTVVYNGHTFTSPSIYADFYSLAATDDCGFLGSSNVVTSTLLSFAPGELSTYAGPLIDILAATYFTPSEYNFANLPCPPKSIMYDQWYKPEPGHPYRPILAFPSKVLDIDPAWASCTANLFTGVDPPRALTATNVMAAPVEAHDALPAETRSVSVPVSNPKTASEPPAAPNEQESQEVAPQAPTLAPISTMKDKSYTKIDQLAQIGHIETTPQISDPTAELGESTDQAAYRPSLIPNNNAPAPAAQTIASVGGLPVVASPLQQASGSMDHFIPETASDGSDPGTNSPDSNDSSKSNDAPAGSGTPAQGSSQVSDSSLIENLPTVEKSPASNNNDGTTVGFGSSSGENGGSPANDDARNTSPSNHDQSSNQDGLNNLPSQEGDIITQLYQVGSSQLTAGGPTLTISGTVVFAPTSGGGVVVGSQTFHPLPDTIPVSDDLPIIGSTTLAAGAHPASAGEEQQVDLEAQNTIRSSQTHKLALPANNKAGETFTPLPSDAGVTVDGTTLFAGGPAITVLGTPVSLDSYNSLHIAGSTHAMPASWVLSIVGTGKGSVPEAFASIATKIAGEALDPVGKAVSVAGITAPPGAEVTGDGGQVVGNAGNETFEPGNQTAKLKGGGTKTSAGTGAGGAAGTTTTSGNILLFEGRATRANGMGWWRWVLLLAATLVSLMRRC